MFKVYRLFASRERKDTGSRFKETNPTNKFVSYLEQIIERNIFIILVQGEHTKQEGTCKPELVL